MNSEKFKTWSNTSLYILSNKVSTFTWTYKIRLRLKCKLFFTFFKVVNNKNWHWITEMRQIRFKRQMLSIGGVSLLCNRAGNNTTACWCDGKLDVTYHFIKTLKNFEAKIVEYIQQMCFHWYFFVRKKLWKLPYEGIYWLSSQWRDLSKFCNSVKLLQK